MTDALALLRRLVPEGRETPIEALVHRVAETGTLNAAGEEVLATLTRDIDVRKRLDLPRAASALAVVFLFAAEQAQERGNHALALKRLNTGVKALDMSESAHADLRSALLSVLDRFCRMKGQWLGLICRCCGTPD